MKKALLWIGGTILVLLILVVVAAYLIDEPLRRRMEANLNGRLKGYSVRIGRLDFHPIGLSLDLEDSTLYQDANPDPPVALIPNLSASVHWRALFSGRLVADFQIDNPTVRFDLRQFSEEDRDEVPIEERGWQDALREIYPLKINRFVIHNGDLTYIDTGPFKPLRITQLHFVAENIRNVESEKGTFPSPIQAEGVVFEKGKIQVNGAADFLAEPKIAVKADLQLHDIVLGYFRPIAERYQLSIRNGLVSADGAIEVTAEGTSIDVKQITLVGTEADYVHVAPSAPTKKMTKEVGKAARKYSNEPTFEMKVDKLIVRNSRLGYINRAAKPVYHVFLSDLAADLSNVSNHLKDGIARGQIKGRFMGSGPSQISLAFRPEKKGPDFDLSVEIEKTDMRAMNDLFRAYGNFDVVAGVFSFYSEIKVNQGKIQGYVKPLFRDMDVYDRRQDREKGIFRKLYDGLIGGISGLLTNQPREEVATQTTLSGDIQSPETSTWEVIVRLIQNAFFKAILPGFEKEVSQPGGGRDRMGRP